ncbi:MAG: penicillin-binding protein, partial [Herminiimonas sp.]|nr:penicillin-binding protein [Herminiimonas sp.]
VDKPPKQHVSAAIISNGKLMRRKTTRKFLRYSMLLLLVCSIVVAIGLSAFLQAMIREAPQVDNLQQVQQARPSMVLAADGAEITSFRRVQREWIALDQISPDVINALISTEDHRFYRHNGVDIKRTAAAIFHTASGDTQGGSTITQQLARNLFPEEIGRSRSVVRKAKEIITAIKIERRYSKRQVLETYLNTVPFLYNVFGIEMAARTYYNKTAAELGPLESATLVGMLKGTHYYNPVANPERARARRNVVLSQMTRHGHLTAGQYETLREQPLKVTFNRPREQTVQTSHFTEYVRKWLAEWAEKNRYDLYSDGLVAHTTLDPGLQEAATQAVARQAEALQNIADVEWSRKAVQPVSTRPDSYGRMRPRIDPFAYFWNSRGDLVNAFIRETPQYKKHIDGGESDPGALGALRQDQGFMAQLRADKTRLEAGFVAVDPASGQVKAWVGSRDFQRDQYDHVAQAERQPGSTFKPIVYGAALELGMSPQRAYYDGAVEIRSTDGAVWRPTDMSAPSERPMTLREGLIYSKNTITAQVMRDVGIAQIVDLAHALGINRSKLDPVPSLALGTSPVTLLEMVSAYTTIARTGEFREPIVVTKITDRHGKTVAVFGKEARRVMSEQSGIELIDMMRGVVNQGTGQAVKSRFGIVADIAGKTGTTQNNTDGWFIMMHPDLVAGSWVGFNDARVTMRSSHWGQGGHNAVLVVGDFFKAVLKNKLIDVNAKFPRPQRAPAMIVNSPPSGDWAEQLEESVSAGSSGEQEGVVIRRGSDGTTVAGDSQGVQMFEQDGRRSTTKTPEEMAVIMSGMGRDPVTGARLDARHAVDLGPPRNAEVAPDGPASYDSGNGSVVVPEFSR